MITIIDYGVGNIKSIQNMLKKISAPSFITNDIKKIAQATHIILPGVGHFDHGMKKLIESGLLEILSKKVLIEKVPILGICLGAQLLTRGSEEGDCEGLGWIDADTIKFDTSKLTDNLKIPHMGWSDVSIINEVKLFSNMPKECRFYFVHSYHIKCDNVKDIAVTTEHGYQFTAGVIKDNIIGMQFHPEKSHKFGMQLLRNFAKKY